MASQHYQSHSCVPAVCTGFAQGSKKIKAAEPFYDVQGGSMCSILSIDATCFFQHYLRALSAKNANHLQTTDTIKRHQRYSIRYHCGWPSLGIWGSATHYGLPALPEPLLRARGLHRVCTGTKNQNSRATLACLWLAQGLHRNHKSKQQSHLTLPSNLITTPICIWYSRD